MQMGNRRFFSIATAAVVVLNLGVVTASSADAAQRDRGADRCVAISGGEVMNATVLDVVADGGTAIGDASGGRGNLAAEAESGRDNNGNGNGNGNNNDNNRGNNNGNNNNGNNNNGNNNNGNNNNNNNRKNNRNNWSAEPLQSLEQRLLQTDTASSGNGGVVTVSADGGAVSIEDVNSGGNVGNAISVGDTVCPGAVKNASGGGGGKEGGNAPTGGGGRGGRIRALPSTGVGELGGGTSGSLVLALGALGMMGLSLGSRLDRRVVRIGGR
jgi:hypothetical protein